MRIGTGVIDPQWHRIVLKDHRSLTHDEACIRALFDRAFANRNKPAGMSLWVERKDDGSAVYYLSPISVMTEPSLVHHLGAVRSATPSTASYLIAGDQTKAP